MIKYIITGTGRCGTGYFDRFLNSNGLKTGHEKIFKILPNQKFNDELSIQREMQKTSTLVESSWLSAPLIATDVINKNIKIIHLVRNPIKVIQSFYNLNFFASKNKNTSYNKFIIDNLINYGFKNNHDWETYISHWIYWNELISDNLNNSNNEYIVFRIEDVDDKISILNDFFSKSLKILNDKTINNKAKRKVNKYSVDDVFDNLRKCHSFEKLKVTAKKYGYEL